MALARRSGPAAPRYLRCAADSTRPPATDDPTADSAAALGVRTSFTENAALRYDILGGYAQQAAAAEETFSIPVAHTYRLDEWREALDVSCSGRAGGKLVFLTS